MAFEDKGWEVIVNDVFLIYMISYALALIVVIWLLRGLQYLFDFGIPFRKIWDWLRKKINQFGSWLCSKWGDE